MDKFSSVQHSYPSFKPFSDSEFMIYTKQYSSNSYVWYFDNGEIIPLCDPASTEEYADSKKRSDAFYAWETKNYQQRQEEKQLADAKWAREHTVTRNQCGACGGKGGTSVENVTSASGVGYRTVYKIETKYISHNYPEFRI